MEQPLLKIIFDTLWEKRRFKNQSDFAKKLDYNRGYIHKLMSSTEKLPEKVRDKLTEVFGISKDYLASNGKEGIMFDKHANNTTNTNGKLIKSETDENQKSGIESGVGSSTKNIPTYMEDRLLALLERMEAARERDQDLRAKDQMIIAHLTGASSIINPNRKGQKQPHPGK